MELLSETHYGEVVQERGKNGEKKMEKIHSYINRNPKEMVNSSHFLTDTQLLAFMGEK